ncbi:MAG: hypothetical protein LBH57_07335 [Treponema sp.]|nr:hypothetical protein [Treponema sp.]
MRKNKFIFGATVFVIALFFMACPGTNDPIDTETGYTVTAQSAANGKLRFEPAGGPSGTPVKIWADPEPGFMLKELKAGSAAVNINATEPWEIILTGDIILTAVFEAVPTGTYTVSIAPLQYGSITAEPKYGEERTPIILTITPAAGYGLKEGSLKYRLNGSDTPITGTSFLMPVGNVTVTAEFETKTAAQLVDAGTEALTDGNFDVAIDAFESAYRQDPANVEATIYSSLSALASIAKDQNVRRLMMNRLGFTGYPGTIGRLITTDWMEIYTDELFVYTYYENGTYYNWFDLYNEWFFNSYNLTPKAGYYYFDYSYENGSYRLAGETPRYDRRDEKLPGLSVPDWFKNTGIYKDGLTSTGVLQASEWPLLLLANLVDKNQNGLNDLLDDILSSVFGAAFEDAAARFKALSYDQSVQMDEELIEAFGLSELLEGDEIYVGKAELDILFSAIRLFKASLEWVAAYDWNTDISFLRTDWQILEDNIDALSPKNLPFGNNFMKNRNNGMMDKSKADFDSALADAIGAYEYLINGNKLPQGFKDSLKEYEWIKDGLFKLKDAIKNGGIFYVPDEEPSGSVYNNSAQYALIGIDMGKLFTPGQFAIDQLITAESGGGVPQFYAFKDDDSPVIITAKAQMDTMDDDFRIGFRLNLARINEVVYGDFLPDGDTLDLPLFPVKIGKDLYGIYHK